MIDSSVTVAQFLQATAARTPTPGGGSVAALAGALSAAMGEMVVNYSIGRKGHEPYAQELALAQKELSNARSLLLQLMKEDQLAYESLREAKKLPEGKPKQAAVAAAMKACIQIPQAIGAAAVRILEIADNQVNFVNPHLLSDLAVCADLAMTTARCAVYNVRVNLPEIASEDERVGIDATVNRTLSQGAAIIRRVSQRIWDRHAAGI